MFESEDRVGWCVMYWEKEWEMRGEEEKDKEIRVV